MNNPILFLGGIAGGIAALVVAYYSLSITADKLAPLPPPPTVTATNKSSLPASQPKAPATVATFGGGCFWCLEAVYEKLPGVTNVVSGYAGGPKSNPTYKEVCTGTSGHAEVVQIHFDPKKITYEELLHVLWQCHDPTTLNRQGADEGTQYRSVIYFHDDAQKAAAEESKRTAAKDFPAPIVTELSTLPTFYPAEDYHQDYYRQNPGVPYCAFVITPKVKKLQEHKVLPK